MLEVRTILWLQFHSTCTMISWSELKNVEKKLSGPCDERGNMTYGPSTWREVIIEEKRREEKRREEAAAEEFYRVPQMVLEY